MSKTIRCSFSGLQNIAGLQNENLSCIMFTPARDFLLETPWKIMIPNPNVNSHSL
jgi:hypothetical protein